MPRHDLQKNLAGNTLSRLYTRVTFLVLPSPLLKTVPRDQPKSDNENP